MKRKRPRYVLKVNIPPPPNAPIAPVPSPSPTLAHSSSSAPNLMPISENVVPTTTLSHVLGLQTYPLNQEETFLPPHLPQPSCGINAFSIRYMTLNIISTITIAKGYTIINTLTAIRAF